MKLIYSPQLQEQVRVAIVTPPGYDKLRGRLPVLLVNDAQNAWTNRGSYGGWHLDGIAARLFSKRQVRPIIIIGIMPPRYRDRTFAPPPEGRADRYTAFLVDTLLPHIRENYRASWRPIDIGIIGASFGANMALYAGLHRPDVITKVAAMSAATHMGKSLDHMLAERRQLPMKRLYIDCGTRWAWDNPYGFGGDHTQFNRKLMDIARHRLPSYAFRGRVHNGHFHNEEFWRKRIPGILKFLFPLK